MDDRYSWANGIQNPLVGNTNRNGVPICTLSEDVFAERYTDELKQEVLSGGLLVYREGLIPRFRHRRLRQIILLGTKGDIFGESVPQTITESILRDCEDCERHVFLCLTENVRKYRDYSLPSSTNIWYGVTLSSDADAWKLLHLPIRNEPVFVRIGPLSHPLSKEVLNLIARRAGWVILSARDWQSKRTVSLPNTEWIQSIVEEVGKTGAKKPVFMEDSLKGIGLKLLKQRPYQMEKILAKNVDELQDILAKNEDKPQKRFPAQATA